MKKLVFMLAAIIIAFGIFTGINTYKNHKNTKAQEVNTYGEKSVSVQTLKQVNEDPFYRNIIFPEQLKENQQTGQNEVVYFFSPVCSYCKALEPDLKDAVKKYSHVNFSLYNAFEFKEGWKDYKIEGTPTLIHFKDGKEVNRLVGYHPKGDVDQFFSSVKQ
ncbi:thioredoxin family protein [Bacillus thuringiensis]|uniref:thioredoxin family protein n=1 Tax=Bacillus thuringiensis TaxID=1428 RepID=UPI0028540BB2|nr:thioredoxin family protein [Bacillus thuringiensis]MDR5021416.1 thioredoxin family protein [Bacillus thuringiensis]